MLWFVVASVPSRLLGTGEVGDVLNEHLEGVVHQLLRVRHLRVEIGLEVQGVDRERVRAVFLPWRNNVQEFASTAFKITSDVSVLEVSLISFSWATKLKQCLLVP